MTDGGTFPVLPTLRTVDLPGPVRPNRVTMNPSIAKDPEGGYRCIVRQTNFWSNGRGYQFLENEGTHVTENLLLTLDDNFNVTSVQEIDDRVARVEPQWPAHGLEDLRLFHRGGDWYVSSVTRERRTDGLCEMHVSHLDGAVIAEDRVIASPAGWRHEKNWMPIQDGDYDFLYVLGPPTPMTVDGTEVRLRGDAVPALPTFGPRGGSQVIRTHLGWLTVSHDVHIRSDNSRWYSQRFHLLDDDWSEIAVSPHWWLGEGEVEYVAGIAETPNGVVLSYGVNDSKARLAEVSWGVVESTLGMRDVPCSCMRCSAKQNETRHVDSSNGVADTVQERSPVA